MLSPKLRRVVEGWRLPEGRSLIERVDAMIAPALLAGHFGSSATLMVAGAQYHLGGEQDTRELADLAGVSADDRLLDVACFLGGPALQLAQERGCGVTGVDIRQECVLAGGRIARLAGLDRQARFCQADARSLPFGDGSFSLVWSQCSLAHDESWLREFDRVLAQGGRLAFTFDIRKEKTGDAGPRWTLPEVAQVVQGLGYEITLAQDISERDVGIGWQALEAELTLREKEFERALGAPWVRGAREHFAQEAQAMRDGLWGNGRIVARKKGE